MTPEYDIAISFAGEQRSEAEALARELKAMGRRVFFDGFEEADLWGKNLYEHLQAVYRDKARFVVILISEAYKRKAWTKHELKAAQERSLTESAEYILPIKIDDVDLPGLSSTVSYVSGSPFDEVHLGILVEHKLRSDDMRALLAGEGFDPYYRSFHQDSPIPYLIDALTAIRDKTSFLWSAILVLPNGKDVVESGIRASTLEEIEIHLSRLQQEGLFEVSITESPSVDDSDETVCKILLEKISPSVVTAARFLQTNPDWQIQRR